MKYKYSGNEIIKTDGQSFLDIFWDDRTVTHSTVQEDDSFSFLRGALIAAAKKFVKEIDIDEVEKNCVDEYSFSYILILLLENTAGKRVVKDIFEETRKFNSRYKKDIRIKLASFYKQLYLRLLDELKRD